MKLASELSETLRNFLVGIGFDPLDFIEASPYSYDFESSILESDSSEKLIVSVDSLAVDLPRGSGRRLGRYGVSIHLCSARVGSVNQAMDYAAQIIEALVMADNPISRSPEKIRPFVRIADFAIPGFDCVTIEFDCVTHFEFSNEAAYKLKTYEVLNE